MRRLVSLVFTGALLVCAAQSFAQQTDFAIGGNTLWSSQNTTAQLGFLPPAEKGGMYPSVSLQYVSARHRGLNAELAFRDKKAVYNSFQPYRPFLYDVNAVYAPTFDKKTSGDFMAGIGGQTVLFYNEFARCPINGCQIHVNSTHFLVHAGAGVKYYFWRNFFARPEAHWYYVVNNVQFHSNNVFRVGVSIGHTFGSR